MIRKMILALTAAIALTAWASAKPGTWGKENPVNENEAKAPAAMLNQWLNEFTAAYEQRDGEKMDELIKRFEGARQEFPAAPRFEKWMASVQEAYKDQDIQKMGRLLDNAQQVREKMRQRIRQNQNQRWRENAEDFRHGQQRHGFYGRPGERMAPRPRDFDSRSPETQGFDRRMGMPEVREFERQYPQRPNHAQYEPRRFTRPRCPEFDQPYYYDQQDPRRQLRHRQRYAPEDFWD